METFKKKVGRPKLKLDEETRKRRRRKQWSDCKRKRRLIDKIEKGLELGNKEPNKLNELYQLNLFNFFNQFTYNYSFTGTLDLNVLERKRLKEINKEIKEQNQLWGLELGYKLQKKIGVKSLRKYTEKYIQFVTDLKIVERTFTTFEYGINNTLHVHILFKSNNKKINFSNTISKSWLLGNSKVKYLRKNLQVTNLNYILKELKPYSYTSKNKNSVDNWFFTGDYTLNKTDIKKKKEFKYNPHINPIPKKERILYQEVQ